MNTGTSKYRFIFTALILSALTSVSFSACSSTPAPEEEIPVIMLSSSEEEADNADYESTVRPMSGEEAVRWEEEQALSEARKTELAALSLETPNTLIGTDEEYIYYLNGRTVDLTKPSVAITYDDGPRGLGDDIMDVMELYGAKCTFFINGVAVHLYTDEVKRMQEEGFEIGNHSYNHPDMAKLGIEDIDFQVGATGRDVAAVTGVTPALMRLPYGSGSDLIYEHVDMPFIQWSIDTLDWESKDADAVYSQVIGKVRDGDIILMHEPYESTVLATSIIVPELIRRDYQLLTVSELAAVNGVTLESGKIYYCFWL